MIFQRSKTVTVDVMGKSWRFNRPPGSVVLGWAPRVAELSKGAESQDRIFPVSVEAYREMLEELSTWVRDIDGEAADELSADDLDSCLIAAEGLQVWIGFFTALNASVLEVGKSEKQSGSDSQKTTQDDPSTTADPAGEAELRH